MDGLRIGQLADAADVKLTTIRYYERRGLMPPPDRNDANYRLYPRESVARLRFIKQAQMLGFSLEEIEHLLSLRTQSETACAEVQQQAMDKIEQIEEKVRLLRQMQASLGRLVKMCDNGAIQGGCPFIQAIEEEEINHEQ